MGEGNPNSQGHAVRGIQNSNSSQIFNLPVLSVEADFWCSRFLNFSEDLSGTRFCIYYQLSQRLLKYASYSRENGQFNFARTFPLLQRPSGSTGPPPPPSDPSTLLSLIDTLHSPP